MANGRAIRSDEEMKYIDKKEADAAYKEMMKVILGAELKNRGFAKYKSNTFVRVSSINNLEIINLQREAYGSRTFTINVAIMPLYINSNFINLSLGKRLGYFSNYSRDYWWDFQNKIIAEKSFREVTVLLIERVLPWLDSINTYEEMQTFVEAKSKYNELYESFRRNEYACFAAMAMGNREKMLYYYHMCEETVAEHPGNRRMLDKLSSILTLSDDRIKLYLDDQIQETVEALKLPPTLAEQINLSSSEL